MQEYEIKMPISDNPNAIGLTRLADVTHFIWLLKSNQVKLLIKRQYFDIADNFIKKTDKELIAENVNVVNALSPTLDMLVSNGEVVNEQYGEDPSQFPGAVGEYTLFINMKIKDILPSATGEVGDMKVSDLISMAIQQQIAVSDSRGNM